MIYKRLENLYPTTNRLFWIYEENEEYYLIDILRHPILLFFGMYRSVFFGMKAKQITKEEAEKYRNPKYDRKGQIVSLGAGACALLSSYFVDYLDKIKIVFSSNIVLIFTITGYCGIFLYLIIHRRKWGYDKLEYSDAKIKMISKNKGIKSWMLYHLMNLVSIIFGTIPYSTAKSAVEHGFIRFIDFVSIFFSLIIFFSMAFIPYLPNYETVRILKREKK